MATSGGSKKNKYCLSTITDAERQLAREAWLQVEYNYTVISKALFSELFKRHPEFKAFFKTLFTDDGTPECWINPKFEKHMVQVLFPAIGNMFRTLDDSDRVTQMMADLGKKHKAKDINLKKKDVEILKGILLETVEFHIQHNTLPQHRAALEKVIHAAFKIFEDNL